VTLRVVSEVGERVGAKSPRIAATFAPLLLMIPPPRRGGPEELFSTPDQRVMVQRPLRKSRPNTEAGTVRWANDQAAIGTLTREAAEGVTPTAPQGNATELFSGIRLAPATPVRRRAWG
jgi:hypothetical protein